MGSSSIFAMLALLVIGYTVGSVRIINQGNEGLVERLGRYRGKLKPGLNFIIPMLDAVVLVDSIRERILDVQPQAAITKDNVALQVDAVVYWKILDLERTYYAVEDIEAAIRELVVTTMRSENGKMRLEENLSLSEDMNKALLDQLDEATEPWGVKVTRVEVQKIEPPPDVIESMQLQQAAELKRRATVLEAQGEQEADIARAEGTVKSIKMLSDALKERPNSKEILNFLIAQSYVESNQKLRASDNSKVVFMDPKMLTEGLVDLMNSPTHLKAPDDETPGRRRRHRQDQG